MKTAAELKITDAEWLALQSVAAGLASGSCTEENGKIFDMHVTCSPHACGTVACIGGWVGIEMGMTVGGADTYVRNCAESIYPLYYPDDVGWS